MQWRKHQSASIESPDETRSTCRSEIHRFYWSFSEIEKMAAVWLCVDNPRLVEVSERTAIGELQREFTQKINDRLQNCGIAPLSKLTAESILSLPEIVQGIN